MTKYLSAKTISENYSYSPRMARELIGEIREQIADGRYPPDCIFDGCGVRVSKDVFENYLRYRKQLRNEVAKDYVPAYEEVEPWNQ